MFDLAQRCPRLSLARRERIIELTRERDERRFVRDKLESAERCVAHRQLQCVRSLGSRSPEYMRYRQRKLDEAARKLQGLQRWADRIGAI